MRFTDIEGFDESEHYVIKLDERKTEPVELQCIECGLVVERDTRPATCSHCNTYESDLPEGVNLYIPREACGWHP